jgi:hypothetical protein
MKILVENYTFNSRSKQVTLTDYTSLDLESILLITNVTDNIIIYNFADPAKGGAVSGNVLTLDYDTSAMSNGDSLQIFIEDGEKSASESTVEALKDFADYLKILVNQTRTLGTQDTAQRLRIAIDSSPTLTVNGNNSNFRPADSANQPVYIIGGDAFSRYAVMPEVWKLIELSRMNYQTSIRPKLIF